jgi:hypothetical protein
MVRAVLHEKSGALVGECHNGGKRSIGSEASITRTFDQKCDAGERLASPSGHDRNSRKPFF